MTAPHSPRDEERADETDGDGRTGPSASPGRSEAPSGHAMGAQKNTGSLLAFGIVCGVMLLLVLFGTVLRALN